MKEMNEKKYKVGFTSGVFDMFHIGHLNILKRAKEHCEFLIVGVSTDEVVIKNKGKHPVIPFNDRLEIVGSIRYVDRVIAQENYDIDSKIRIAVENDIDVMFVGSDWEGTTKWDTIESKLKDINIDVIYLPHTDGISSTLLRDKIDKYSYEKND